MKFYNLKKHQEQVTFSQAVQQGLGAQQGLFFPLNIPQFNSSDIEALLKENFISRSTQLLKGFLGDEVEPERLSGWLERAFNFAIPVVSVTPQIKILELFHGPTLAFKDFGARFMAQVLSDLCQNRKITILTATSGDTGAAVAHAFYGLQNINVVVLYPKGKISPLQEKLFCCLGNNIHTIAIEGDFDACQALVKQAFDDPQIVSELGLNSANSINVSRLLAQTCYYFEAVAQLSKKERDNLVIAVPCGNFGNLTAGLLAKAMGLPIKRFIAATNANDTVPRFLASGTWLVQPTQATLSNAMDVSSPNNWPRIEELFLREEWSYNALASLSVDDQITQQAMQELYALGYITEPHAAIAYQGLKQFLQDGETGLFLGTAHPAKFKQSVEDILNIRLPLPAELAVWQQAKLLSKTQAADFKVLKHFLLELV